MKTYDQIAGQRIQRLEAISDGVFAIALTILVLDIKVPITEVIHSETDLMIAFYSLTPKLLTYFLSFMTLGIFWAGHSVQFQFVKKSDRHFNWINLFFLLFVTIVPFNTALLSEYITFKFAIALYWLNLFLLGAMLYIGWIYAKRHDFLTLPAEEKAEVDKAIKQRIIITESFYALAALLCFISTYLSITIILLVQLNSAFAPFARFKK